MNQHSIGIIAAIASNILFSLLFFYGSLMQPMSGVDIFAWRMFASLPAICLLISFHRLWRSLWRFIAEIGGNWRKWLLIMLPTPIMAGQLCLFMWAPTQQKGIDVAIGYFLFPLAMALGGVLCFKEKLNRTQKIAICLAAVGVGIEIIRTQTFSWVSMVIFSTYPIYFLLRKQMNIPSLIGLFIDMCLIFPFICLYLYYFSPSLMHIHNNPMLICWIIILGLHGALAMQLNFSANHYLPVILFSILSYIEPALLFLISIIFLKEPLHLSSLISYGFIWIGLLLVIRENVQDYLNNKSKNKHNRAH